MPLYINCQSCRGKGYFECDACICKTCKRTTRVQCSSCRGGRLPCVTCAATGRVSKKGVLFSHQERCPVCIGSGGITCDTCMGQGSVLCFDCNGRGRYSYCSTCGGANQVTCQSCNGVGRFEGEWLKTLKRMSIEKLRFELDKRRFELTNLQRRYSELNSDMEDIQYALVETPFDGLFEMFEKTKKRMYEVESEIKAIERELGSKLI